jgi:hypothetical protein
LNVAVWSDDELPPQAETNVSIAVSATPITTRARTGPSPVR